MNWYEFADASGMDFRALLKKRKYAKWAQDKAELEDVDLKHTELPLPQLKKVDKVRLPVTFLHFFKYVILLKIYLG